MITLLGKYHLIDDGVDEESDLKDQCADLQLNAHYQLIDEVDRKCRLKVEGKSPIH